MATAVAPPVTAKTTTSVDPLYTQALAQAKAALGAQVAPIAGEQAASDANFAQQEKDTTDAAAALSKMQQPIGPAVNGMYQTAAQNQELAANGFSQGMQDALTGNTNNLNSMLAKLGSPQTIDSHAQQAGDMLYSVGGYNPGTAFSKEGAAFGSAAELQAGDSILKGQETSANLKNQAVVADQGFQAKIAELAGKLPGDAQTNYLHLQTLALNNAKFREQVSKDNFTQKLSIDKYNTGIQEFNAKQAMASQKMAQAQMNSDRTYQVTLQRLGIAQQSLQLKVTAAAFKAANGGYTTKELNKIQIQAVGLAHSYYGGSTSLKQTNTQSTKTGGTAAGSSTASKTTGTSTAGLSYTDALGKLLQKGIPVQIALRALNSVYPATSQLGASDLAAYLGPLTPAAIAAASARLDAAGGTAVANAAGYGLNPYTVDNASMKNLSPAGKQTVNGVMSLAREYLGTPYVWGGESPQGFDCSGLAQYIYGKEGIQIPRTTYDQFQTGLNVPTNQLQAGDLVFFRGSDSRGGLPGHVGIFIGSGKFIEAPYTGSVVRVSNLAGYPGYMGARRYVH
jgi:cell wall-associated NlpC family hydrolase